MINEQKPKDKDEAHTQLPNDNVSQVNISQAEPEDTADTTKFELVIKSNQDESIVCRRCKKKMGSGVRCSQCRSTWHWSCGGVKGEDKTDVISASKWLSEDCNGESKEKKNCKECRNKNKEIKNLKAVIAELEKTTQHLNQELKAAHESIADLQIHLKHEKKMRRKLEQEVIEL